MTEFIRCSNIQRRRNLQQTLLTQVPSIFPGRLDQRIRIHYHHITIPKFHRHLEILCPFNNPQRQIHHLGTAMRAVLPNQMPRIFLRPIPQRPRVSRIAYRHLLQRCDVTRHQCRHKLPGRRRRLHQHVIQIARKNRHIRLVHILPQHPLQMRRAVRHRRTMPRHIRHRKSRVRPSAAQSHIVNIPSRFITAIRSTVYPRINSRNRNPVVRRLVVAPYFRASQLPYIRSIQFQYRHRPNLSIHPRPISSPYTTWISMHVTPIGYPFARFSFPQLNHALRQPQNQAIIRSMILRSRKSHSLARHSFFLLLIVCIFLPACTSDIKIPLVTSPRPNNFDAAFHIDKPDAHAGQWHLEFPQVPSNEKHRPKVARYCASKLHQGLFSPFRLHAVYTHPQVQNIEYYVFYHTKRPNDHHFVFMYNIRSGTVSRAFRRIARN